MLVIRVNSFLNASECQICNTFAKRRPHYFFLWRCDPTRVMTSSFLRFLDHTQQRTTVSRTPLDEWSARRRDLYPTTHNTHNRRTSMPLVGFEPRISAGERPRTYAFDRAATGTGNYCLYIHKICITYMGGKQLIYFYAEEYTGYKTTCFGPVYWPSPGCTVRWDEISSPPQYTTHMLYSCWLSLQYNLMMADIQGRNM
jgi:hypothetical protein